MEEVQQAELATQLSDVLEWWRGQAIAVGAELAARTEHWSGIEFGLREENRKLRIEVERLRRGNVALDAPCE